MERERPGLFRELEPLSVHLVLSRYALPSSNNEWDISGRTRSIAKERDDRGRELCEMRLCAGPSTRNYSYWQPRPSPTDDAPRARTGSCELRAASLVAVCRWIARRTCWNAAGPVWHCRHRGFPESSDAARRAPRAFLHVTLAALLAARRCFCLARIVGVVPLLN